MAKTVLIYASVPLWEYHHAESVELALSHLAKGDDVHVLTCRGALVSCAANARHHLEACNTCLGHQRRTRKILGKRVTWHGISLQSPSENAYPRFSSIGALRDFSINDVPHGAFVASQLVDDIRDGYPDLDRYADACGRLLGQSTALFDYATRLIADIEAQHVYVWNGRRPSDGPVIWAARKLGVPFTSHIWDYDEPWGFSKGFITISGSTFHNLNKIHEVVRAEDGAKPLLAEERRAAESYLNEVTSAGRRLFGANFRDAPLAFLRPGVRKISIFTTSEWEIAGEPTWANHLYPSQWDGIEAIASDKRFAEGVQFIVRLHPNLANSPPASGEWSRIRAVQRALGSRAHFVEPRDQVDSYLLVQASNTVVTFGSTVGIEAALRGKPVVLLSKAPYQGTGICYEPDSHEDAVSLLCRQLEPTDRDNVLRYAHRRLEKVWDRVQLRHLRQDEKHQVWFGNYRLVGPTLAARIRGLAGRVARRVGRPIKRALKAAMARFQ